MRAAILNISDQSIPNILFLKHFNINKIVFITSERMEKLQTTKHIINALSLDGSDVHSEIVNENSFTDISKKLDKLYKNSVICEGDELFINITGGTKIMSFAVKEFFERKTDNIFYMPIGESIFLNMINYSKENNSIFIDVRTYLMAYGISIQESLEQIGSTLDLADKRRETTIEIGKLYFSGRKNNIDNAGNNFRQLRNISSLKKKKDNHKSLREMSEKSLDINLENLTSALNVFPAPYKNAQSICYRDIEYLTGGWFEEYVYIAVKDVLSDYTEKSDIMLNIHIEKSKDNEIDVIFTYNNSIYVCECKTGELEIKHKDFTKDIKDDVLYKSGALKTLFGINVRFILFTTAQRIIENNQVIDNVKNRAKVLGITLFPEFMLEFDVLKKNLKEMLNL